jgi:hypothetical protein
VVTTPKLLLLLLLLLPLEVAAIEAAAYLNRQLRCCCELVLTCHIKVLCCKRCCMWLAGQLCAEGCDGWQVAQVLA